MEIKNQLKVFGNGPTKVLIMAGMHGDELTPIRTLQLLAEEFEQKTTDRSYYSDLEITILNGINLLGLRTGIHDYSPRNDENLNRCCTVVDYIEPEKFLKEELIKYDVLIDVHSSSGIQEFFLVDQDEHTLKVLSLLEAARVDYGIRYCHNDTSKRFMLNNGKLGLTLELNGLNYLDRESSVRGTFMIFRLLLKINNFPVKLRAERIGGTDLSKKYPCMEELKSSIEGLVVICPDTLSLLSEFGMNRIEKGNIIGHVVPINGGCSFPIVAPCRGFFLGIDKGYVRPGETAVLFQPVDTYVRL